MQKWIRTTVENECTSNISLINPLVRGDDAAQTQIQHTAMLALIADLAPIDAGVCPETLLFDVKRLESLQTEYRFLVVASTLLARLAHQMTHLEKSTNQVC